MKRIFTILLLALSSWSVFSQTTQTFTSSGIFMVPNGVSLVTIEVVGAGGAGGGNGGGGGGGGAYAKGTYAVVPGQIMNVTIGTAGGGTIGGSTSVDNLITAYGGGNGVSVSNPNIGGGGAGGTATGGTIVNRTGGNGGGGYWTYFGGGGGGAAGIISNGSNGGNTIAWTGICQTPGGSSGASGGAPGGDGGKGAGFTDVSCNVSDPAGNGLNYGGGGGGGNGNGGGPGTGVDGFASITYDGCSINPATTTLGTTISANQAGVTYQWINCSGNTIIGGETNQSYTPTQSGNYAVILDNGTCSDTSACVNIIICNLNATTNQVGNTISANETGTYQWINCIGNTVIGGQTGQNFTPTQTGNYAVIVNDGNCVDTSSCVNVVVCTLSATTTLDGDTIQANETGTYQWINCVGNTVIGGATNQQFIPVANGSYAVIITNAGCIDTSACVVIVTLGINKNDENAFTVFPNPFHHYIQVLKADGDEMYELTNSIGQVIWSGMHIETKDFSTLTNGIYFLRIIDHTHVFQTRLIRQ